MNELVFASVADAAAALDHATQQIIAGEVGQVLAIAAMCDLHRVDETVLFEGAEEWITGGAAGTPRIGEFLAGEVAALLGISVGAAGFRIADVLNLRHRHPRLWDQVMQGQIRFWQATQITQACAQAGLGLEASLWVDDRMATALGFLPWSRVRNLVSEWIVQADPELARLRAERLSAQRYVEIDQIQDGHCSMWGRLDATDGILFDQALDVVADSIDQTAGDKQVRRAAAVGVLARTVFGQAQLPASTVLGEDSTATDGIGDSADAVGDALDVAGVDPAGHANTFRRDDGMGAPGAVSAPRSCELVVRVSAKDLADPTTGVVDVQGRGLLFADRLGDLLAGCKVTVRPIIDPEAIAPTDSYRIPDDMRLAVEERNPFDVFPYGVRRSRVCDLDHTIPFDHHNKAGVGQTRPENLGPLSRYAHRLKTHGGWRLAQPQPGVFRWESPLGYQYFVTPSGSVRIRRPEPPPPQHWWQIEPPDEPDPPEHLPPALE